MDSITQALLGATIQGVGMGKYQGRKALLYGALLGTLPDLDVLVRYSDPISTMTYHRGFSHSIFILTGLAFLISWFIFKRKATRAYSFKRLFITLMLVLVTHPIIDAMTVYGTQLLWPFEITPTIWATVFIIDPIYTLPLLATCIWALLKKVNSATRQKMLWALIFGAVYFGIGFIGRYYHENRVENSLNAQGIKVEKILASPTAFNTVLWRVIAIDDQGNLYDAVSGWFDQKQPEMIKLPLNLELKQQVIAHSPQLQRLSWFTNDWLQYQQIGNQLIVSDARMGLAGQFHFRFVIAEKSAGEWQVIQPKNYPSSRHYVNIEILKQLWHRIWSDAKPLPLELWQQLK